METCHECGGPVQYEEGRLTQEEMSLEDGIGETIKCRKCAGPQLAEMLLKAEEGTGHYQFGAVRLAWELKRHDEAPSGMPARCLRSFLELVIRTMEKFGVGPRVRAERALKDLVGPDGPHAQTCDCRKREPGDLCPWCRGRLVLKAAR